MNASFLQHENIKQMLPTYSQFGQDLKVLDFYARKENCYFVEIGSGDGVLESNTYLLEQKFSWSGICVEPVGYQFEKLVVNRTCICVNKAVYDETVHEVEFCEAENDIRHLSGIKSYLLSNLNVINRSKIVKMETIALTRLLEQNGAPGFIEYLSLDTEGSEFEILKCFNFNKFQFGYINVEHNFHEKKRQDIRNLLTCFNYRYVGENNVDDIYVHNCQK